MDGIYSTFPLLTKVTMEYMMQDYKLMFIIAMITFILIVMLKTKRLFISQTLLFLAMIMMSTTFSGVESSFANVVFYVLLAIQILFGLYVLYKIRNALVYNYTLILEKTHQIPSNITKMGNSGSEDSFI